MAAISVESTFQVEANPGCWNGSLSPFERKLLRPLPLYALEQLRARFLHAVTADHSLENGARAVLQMAHETELKAALARTAPPAPGALESRVCARRRYVEIDRDMKSFRFLYGPALEGLMEAEVLPVEYSELLLRHLNKPYAKSRVGATAALLCFAAALLITE